MKITKITTYRLPPRWMFLKIETDEGVVGWGEPVIEGRARTVEAAVHELGDYLIGQDPSRINDLWQVMYRAGFLSWRSNPDERHCRDRPGVMGYQRQSAECAGLATDGRPGSRQN